VGRSILANRDRGDTTVDLLEVTEATDEADQKGMTAFERSRKSAALLGEFGGRFADGASRPGFAWAADIVDAIRRKDGKAIFQDLPTRRHLLVSRARRLRSHKVQELRPAYLASVDEQISQSPQLFSVLLDQVLSALKSVISTIVAFPL
jgi:hypothetical protein